MKTDREPPAAAAVRRGQTTLLPGQTPQGGHILSVLLKRSYSIVAGAVCQRAEEDQPLLGGDLHWDSPMNSSVRLESDFVPLKLRTDVVLIGKAHAPGGQPAAQWSVGLQVGSRRKILRVTGDRQARFTSATTAPVFTDPQPMTALDLRYEYAYGGIDVRSDLSSVWPYPRNTRGRGFVVANQAAAVDGQPLPNIEDPAAVLTPDRLCVGEYARWDQQPEPAGFGWLAKDWRPRALLAGVMPADREVERELRAAYEKLVPAEQRDAYRQHGLPDMNFEFFNGAPADMRFGFQEEPLAGSLVRTANLSPQGTLDFHLPADEPRVTIDIGDGEQMPDTVLHTVQIRLEDREVDMVWRAALPYPGPDWLPQMKTLSIRVLDGPPARRPTVSRSP